MKKVRFSHFRFIFFNLKISGEMQWRRSGGEAQATTLGFKVSVARQHFGQFHIIWAILRQNFGQFHIFCVSLRQNFGQFGVCKIVLISVHTFFFLRSL